MSSKRQDLIDTGERLFHEEGFFATGVDRIVRQAGTTRRTFYQYFTSKESLVEAVLRQRDRSYFDAIDRSRPAPEAGALALALHVAETHLQFLFHDAVHGCLFIKALGEYEAHSTTISALATEHKRSLHRYLTRLLADAGATQPEALALDLATALEGATQYAQLMPPEVIGESLRRQIHRCFTDKEVVS